MRRVPLACLLALALGLAACGGGDESALLPGPRADALLEALDQVDQDVSRRDCDGAEEALTALRRQVQGLPRRVDRDLRARLEEGTATLERQAAEQCAEPEPTETTEPTETVPTETVPTETTETVPTETTPTETVPTTPTDTEPTTPTEPPPPQDDDSGPGNSDDAPGQGGSGNGNGLGTGGGGAIAPDDTGGTGAP